jgi:REP element-mobilizing transposase RayT
MMFLVARPVHPRDAHGWPFVCRDVDMPRAARAMISGCGHHVAQRGNNRQDVFFVDADRRAYLAYLQDAARRSALPVEGYCLMTSHVRLVVTPHQESSLPEALKRTNQLYASDVFTAKLETILGRRLRPPPPTVGTAKWEVLGEGRDRPSRDRWSQTRRTKCMTMTGRERRDLQ